MEKQIKQKGQRGQREILRDIEKLRTELRCLKGLGETGVATITTTGHDIMWQGTYNQLVSDPNIKELQVKKDDKLQSRYPQGFQVAYSRKDTSEQAAKLVRTLVQKKILDMKKSLEICKDRNLVM